MTNLVHREPDGCNELIDDLMSSGGQGAGQTIDWQVQHGSLTGAEKPQKTDYSSTHGIKLCITEQIKHFNNIYSFLFYYKCT